MINLFKNTSSNWVRYDKYEWKEDKAGTLYITPAPDAQPSLYDQGLGIYFYVKLSVLSGLRYVG